MKDVASALSEANRQREGLGEGIGYFASGARGRWFKSNRWETTVAQWLERLRHRPRPIPVLHVDGFRREDRPSQETIMRTNVKAKSTLSTHEGASELIEIGHRLWGKRGWQSAMAAALRVDTSTIRRWMYADSVPGPAAAALRCLDETQRGLS